MIVHVTSRAKRRIAVVDKYWREHRLDAPRLFAEELDAACTRLEDEPYAGHERTISGKICLRLLRPKSRQWIYYRVLENRGRVVVDTVWGAQRGRDPVL